jgi:hypothetical protein
MFAIALTLLAAPRIAIAVEDGGDARDLVHFRQEIDSLKGSEAPSSTLAPTDTYARRMKRRK